MQIDGKVVLITGASEGIGAACAREFRKRGARLSLTARSEDKLKDAGGADAVVIQILSDSLGATLGPREHEAAAALFGEKLMERILFTVDGNLIGLKPYIFRGL